jgi:hypothetical protein
MNIKGPVAVDPIQPSQHPGEAVVDFNMVLWIIETILSKQPAS